MFKSKLLNLVKNLKIYITSKRIINS